jgi:hypothetical protein
MNIYLIVRLGGSLTNLMLFVFSLRSFWTPSPVFAKVFSALCFLEVVADIIEWVANQHEVQQITSNLVTLSEMVIYTFIFLQIIHSRLVKWILSLLISILALLYLWIFLRKGLSHPVTFDMELMNYAVFLIPAFTYFKEIFTFQQEGDLLKDFTFWFVTASLFIFASTIISRLGIFYLYTLKLGDYGNNFFLLSGLVFIIVNILYIKAYLCLRK